MPQLVELSDLTATALLGRALSGILQMGDMVALRGDLGSGKTTLARAIIHGFLPEEEVPSPTFNFVQTYHAAHFDIVHFDLYRLESPENVFELGWEDALGQALVLVEWPERLGNALPADRLDIALESELLTDSRKVRLTPRGLWRDRIIEPLI